LFYFFRTGYGKDPFLSPKHIQACKDNRCRFLPPIALCRACKSKNDLHNLKKNVPMEKTE
jgi:hypothetical protein